MSSFTRRIQRTQSPSQKVHPVLNRYERITGFRSNPPRKSGYMGRGSKLGVTNPKGKELLARLARERRNAKC